MPLFEGIEFYNPTDEDFVGSWDGEPYEIRAKSSILVPRNLAEHFAKHLATRILSERFNDLCKKHTPNQKDSELNKCKKCIERRNKNTNIYTCPEREELYKEMIRDKKAEALQVVPLQE